jgi:HMG box transcription factor BBX
MTLRNTVNHFWFFLFQYKDAFFSANPHFKWYKLPAPPLRTLSSRPRESIEKQNELPNHDINETELEKTNNNSTKVDFNKRSNEDHVYENDQKPLSMFTPGKLADEAQMGGLSSLLATKTENQTPNPFYSPPALKFNAISTPNEYRSHHMLEKFQAKGASREESIRELQNALTETTKIFEEDFDEESGLYRQYNMANDQFTNQDVIDQIVDKRYKDDDYGYQKNWSDDERNAKSGRSCKGKRYQEFMAVGGLIVNKRQRRDNADKMPDEGYSPSCSWETGNSRSEESMATDDSKQDSSVIDTSAESETKNDIRDASEADNNANKTFKAADFDLDAKIKALPSLSLEKFQQRKRENKRKKKTVSLKPKMHEPSQIVNSVPRPYSDERREMAECWRESVIGSQKRKPRKVSITRFEFKSIYSSVDTSKSHKISPETKIATEAPCTVVQSMEIGKQPPAPHSSVDLLALATLAEVAANTSKIEDAAILDVTAKATDGNASKV